MTSISSSYSSMSMQRPDPTQMASKLFSKLDTKSQGYLEKSDLESAFASISGDGDNVDALFSKMDSDSDGKVTESEMSSALQKLAEELDNQFSQMRMQGGMPPPPPPSGDEGFTQEELSSQLEEIGSTDSQRSELISSIVNNFEAADSDGDGKVSATEAMAYAQQNQEQTASTSTTSSESSENRLLQQVMQLMQAYGGGMDMRSGTQFSANA